MCESQILLQREGKSQQRILGERTAHDLQADRQAGRRPAAGNGQRRQTEHRHGGGGRHIVDDARHGFAVNQQDVALRVWERRDARGHTQEYVVLAKELRHVLPDTASFLLRLEESDVESTFNPK